MKRIKIVPERLNCLFETWLEEWRNEAVLRNSELRNHFAKALDSLRRYPLPLESGKECIILQHFGTKLCSMLDKKQEEHRRQEDNSTKAIDACFFEIDNNGGYAITSRKESAEECKIVEVQEKTAIVKQAKNTKKTASKRLVNATENASREINKRISLELSTFDIVLLVDTQETCGCVFIYSYDLYC